MPSQVKSIRVKTLLLPKKDLLNTFHLELTEKFNCMPKFTLFSWLFAIVNEKFNFFELKFTAETYKNLMVET